MHRTHARLGKLALFGCAGAVLATPALAQPAPAQPAALEEIVVTATRRDERLQDVPIAVTAVSAERLERQQVNDVRDIQAVAPSLQLMPFPNDPSAVLVSMRGQGSPQAAITQDPAVGIYMDGVYMARAAGANLELADLERVEVLRGPQGTLFGRNTIGGAINIIPKKPVDSFEGLIGGSVGNYESWSLRGVLNVPISDQAAVRIAAKHSQHDGYARSSITGEPLDAVNTDAVRAQLRFRPAQAWEVLLSADYSHIDSSAQWVTLVDVPPGSALRTLPARVGNPGDDILRYVDRYARRTAIQSLDGRPGKVVAEAWGVAGTVTGELVPSVTVKSITAYRENTRDGSRLDLDGTPYFFSMQASDYAPANVAFQEQFSQELQLFGKTFDDRLDWIVGAYYFKETGGERNYSYNSFPAVRTVSIGDGDIMHKSVAAYAQLTYALTEQLRLTAGLRYTKDTRAFVSRNRTVNPITGAINPNVPTASSANVQVVQLPNGVFQAEPRDAVSSYWPWTIGLDYRATPNVMVYGKVSRGFRAGGFNLRGANAQALEGFDPERVTSYELGLKSDLLDRRLRLNGSIYQTDYDAIQLSQVVPTGLVNPAVTAAIRNAGTARIRGAEVEAEALVGVLRLNGSVGYTDPEFTGFEGVVTGANLDSKFDGVPKWTAHLGADYPVQTALGELNLHADYSYVSERFFAYTPPANPAARDGAYGLLNAMATLRLDDRPVEISVWGRNLADTRYLQRAHDLVLNVVGFPGAPRTYGVTVTYRFGE